MFSHSDAHQLLVASVVVSTSQLVWVSSTKQCLGYVNLLGVGHSVREVRERVSVLLYDEVELNEAQGGEPKDRISVNQSQLIALSRVVIDAMVA